MCAWVKESNGDWALFCNGVKLARLIPNDDSRYAGWYVTWIEEGFIDGGYGAVDCCSLAEGQQFLEEWARRIGRKAA